MARILFTTFGSLGDLYPYIAIGRELRRRGHEVTIGTSVLYQAKVEAENLRFFEIRPDTSLDDSEFLQYVFHERHGPERVIRLISSVIRESYADTLEASRDIDVIVTHPITYGAVLVARQKKLPWISTVLAPISFVSAYDPPVLGPAPWLTKLKIFGPGPLTAIFRLGKRSALPWIQPVTDLAKELGLYTSQNPVFEGSNSPDLVLALFSALLAQKQPDWPPQTVVTGFPVLSEGPEEDPLAPELLEFFEAGPAPIVFTLGSSAIGAAGALYREGLECAQRLGARALFLTGSHSHDLPDPLPRGMFEWPYAPHSAVFPRASVIVHQAGAGTTAQALRSGRAQLIVPFAHDQFDNAARVRPLGVAEVLWRSRFTAARAEPLLNKLLSQKNYTDQAGQIASQIRSENGTITAANAVEAYIQRRVPFRT